MRSDVFADPPGGEVLDIRYSLCEFARDKALHRSADQRDFDLDRPIQRQQRPIGGRHARGGGRTGARCAGHGDGDLSVEPVAECGPYLGVPDLDIAPIELRDDPGQQVATQVLGGGHPHGPVVVDAQGFEGGAATEGAKPGQPVTLRTQGGVNLVDTDGRLDCYIERTGHRDPPPVPGRAAPNSWPATDPPGARRKSASAPAVRAARWSAEA